MRCNANECCLKLERNIFEIRFEIDSPLNIAISSVSLGNERNIMFPSVNEKGRQKQICAIAIPGIVLTIPNEDSIL